MYRKNLWAKPAAFLLPVLLVVGLALAGCGNPVGPSGPAAPAITSVVPASTTSLTVTWEAVPGATSYEVYHAEIGNPMPQTATATLAAESTSLNNLTAGTTYQVWVNAVNTAGSALSDPWETVVYDPALLNDLEGIWVSSYGEEYVIENMEFASGWGGTTAYKGPIVNIRKDTDSDSEKGYITIRYTENSYSPNVVGNYYVIRWEGWAADSTIVISGAVNDDGGAGHDTISEAQTQYSGDIGAKPFLVGSDCFFITGEGKSSAITGTWKNEAEHFSYVITDKLVIFAYMSQTYFVGEIVNVRNLEDDANYITFKFITNSSDEELVGKYCVLYWTKLQTADETTTADMAAVYKESMPGDDGKDSQEKAEESYVDVVNDIDSDGPYEFTLVSSS
jgi:hypothetical protein